MRGYQEILDLGRANDAALANVVDYKTALVYITGRYPAEPLNRRRRWASQTIRQLRVERARGRKTGFSKIAADKANPPLVALMYTGVFGEVIPWHCFGQGSYLGHTSPRLREFLAKIPA